MRTRNVTRTNSKPFQIVGGKKVAIDRSKIVENQFDTKTWGWNAHKDLKLFNKWDEVNAPAVVKQSAIELDSPVGAFWCYYHGQYAEIFKAKVITLEDDKEVRRLDTHSCQCPECARLGVNYYLNEI